MAAALPSPSTRKNTQPTQTRWKKNKTDKKVSNLVLANFLQELWLLPAP